MSSISWLLTVHYNYIPTETYMFVHLRSALKGAAMVKQSHPDLRINLTRKELTREQCEAVLSRVNPPT